MQDGDTYEGEWKDDKCEGFGIYKTKIGATYEGQVPTLNLFGSGKMMSSMEQGWRLGKTGTIITDPTWMARSTEREQLDSKMVLNMKETL